MARTSSRRAAVVPVSPAAVGPPEGVAVQEDRPVLALGPGDREDHDAAASSTVSTATSSGPRRSALTRFRSRSRARMARTYSSARGRSTGRKLLSLRSSTPRKDDAPQGVGEGGIALPQALRQAPQGQLRLDAVVLPVVPDAAKIDHRRPSPVVFPIIPRTQQKGKRLRGEGKYGKMSLVL